MKKIFDGAAVEKKEAVVEANALRKILTDYLRPGGAHTHKSLADAAADFPMKLANRKLPKIPYSAWGLLEHIRITQHDILEFIRNPDYEAMSWPDDYWPIEKLAADEAMWTKTLEGYTNDLNALIAIMQDPTTDLFAPIQNGKDGQTILQEVLQVIDHASYHIGEFVLLRRMLGAWKDDSQ